MRKRIGNAESDTPVLWSEFASLFHRGCRSRTSNRSTPTTSTHPSRPPTTARVKTRRPRELSAGLRELAKLTSRIRAGEESEDVYIKRGGLYLGMRKYVQAVRDFSRAIAINPRSARAYLNRGSTYGRLRQFHQAIEDYTQSLRFRPSCENGPAYYNLGVARKKMKNFRKSKVWLRRAVGLNFEDTLAHFELGKVNVELREYSAALRNFSHAIRSDSRSSVQLSSLMLTERGKVGMKLNRSENAIRDFSRAIALDPLNSTALFQRGEIHYRNNEMVLASADFEQTIQVAPKSEEATKAADRLLEICENSSAESVLIATSVDQGDEDVVQSHNLRGVVTDLNLVYQLFVDIRIRVRRMFLDVRTPSKNEVLEEIRSLFISDTINCILYYTGHGSGSLETGMKGAWCFQDHELMGFGEIFDLWVECRCQNPAGFARGRLFIILDCCHAGTWVEELIQKENRRNVFIQASCPSNELSSGDAGGGKFTRWWVKKALQECKDSDDQNIIKVADFLDDQLLEIYRRRISPVCSSSGAFRFLSNRTKTKTSLFFSGDVPDVSSPSNQEEVVRVVRVLASLDPAVDIPEAERSRSQYLQIVKGELLEVLDVHSSGWWWGKNSRGEEGYFSVNLVRQRDGQSDGMASGFREALLRRYCGT